MPIHSLIRLLGQPPAGEAAIPSVTSDSCWIQGFTWECHYDGGPTSLWVLKVVGETVGKFLIRREGTKNGISKGMVCKIGAPNEDKRKKAKFEGLMEEWLDASSSNPVNCHRSYCHI